MVSREEIESVVKSCRDDMHRTNWGTPSEKTIVALADENATLRAQLAECMAQVERMRTRLEFLSKLKGTP